MIKPKTSIYIPSLSKELDMDVYNTLKKANISSRQMKLYEEALDPKIPLGKRLYRFITATNEAGRKAKIIKDFALLFLPWGKQVSNLTELATDIIKHEQIKDVMETKPWYKSKTVQSILVIITLVSTQFFGLEITEAELQETVTAVGVAIASVVALYGRITAKHKLE